jgi:tRNA dimethylallyltransferase
LSIGTAKPTREELSVIRHHFVDFLSIKDNYSAGQFETEAISFLDDFFKKKDVCICAGGSGLYVNAIISGLDDLPSDSVVREKWNSALQSKGLKFLQEELKKLDSAHYHAMDIQNPQRVIRALEICEISGKKYSELRKNSDKKRSFIPIIIGLNRDRAELYERINQRVDQMMSQGLLDEVKSVCHLKHLNSLNTVGYKEIFKFFDGELSLEESVELLKRNTRRFAKRQLTWFKRYDSIKWFHPDYLADVIYHVDSIISEKNNE